LVQWISLQISMQYCSYQITIFANLPPPSKCLAPPRYVSVDIVLSRQQKGPPAPIIHKVSCLDPAQPGVNPAKKVSLTRAECVWDKTDINNTTQTQSQAKHTRVCNCLLTAGDADDWDAEPNVRLREMTALGTMAEDDSDLPGDDLRTSHANDVGLHQQSRCTLYSHWTVASLFITLADPCGCIIQSSFITK